MTLQNAAEMKAGAMREGLAAADAQAASATEEANALRYLSVLLCSHHQL